MQTEDRHKKDRNKERGQARKEIKVKSRTREKSLIGRKADWKADRWGF